MEEMKLTDEEIVKELINESNRGEWCELNFIDCVEVRVLKNAIDLIHRVQAENEKLRNAKVIYETVDYCAEDLKKTQAEIERLTAFEAKAKCEIERLTEERKTANMHDLMYWFNAYNECVNDCEKYVIEASDNKAECMRLQKQARERCEEFQKQVDELTKESARLDKNVKWFQEKIENGELVSEQAVKNTAKEIWNRAYKIACNTRGEITEQSIKEIAKREYGVEME